MGFNVSSHMSLFILFFLAALVSANWDPSTGYLHNHRPSPAWTAKYKPSVSTPGIQVSECAINTRLHYPNVQLFAWFEVNHVWDGNHGCPYGTCHAYVVNPTSAEMVPSFTDGHSFFWHNIGGLRGNGVKPISNPKNGGYGYEDSLSGKFVDGPANTRSMQPGHDAKYPGFDKKKLHLWTPAQVDSFKGSDQSQKHPKCGRPCENNKDPGSSAGAYGGYKPASGSAYKPPKGWQPGNRDTCFKNGNQAPPKSQESSQKQSSSTTTVNKQKGNNSKPPSAPKHRKRSLRKKGIPCRNAKSLVGTASSIWSCATNPGPGSKFSIDGCVFQLAGLSRKSSKA